MENSAHDKPSPKSPNTSDRTKGVLSPTFLSPVEEERVTQYLFLTANPEQRRLMQSSRVEDGKPPFPDAPEYQGMKTSSTN